MTICSYPDGPEGKPKLRGVLDCLGIMIVSAS